MISNRSGERSFSKLKTIENMLRTSLTQSKLVLLAVISVECDILRELNFTAIIQDFAARKARKVFYRFESFL